jgi:hypothetical protein
MLGNLSVDHAVPVEKTEEQILQAEQDPEPEHPIVGIAMVFG